MGRDKEIEVECYSGSRYGERPLSFVIDKRKLAVQRIERMWRTPEALHFNVRTKEGRFHIFYDESKDAWFLYL